MIKLDGDTIRKIREDKQCSLQEAQEIVFRRTLSEITKTASSLDDLRPVLLAIIERMRI